MIERGKRYSDRTGRERFDKVWVFNVVLEKGRGCYLRGKGERLLQGVGRCFSRDVVFKRKGFFGGIIQKGFIILEVSSHFFYQLL